MTTPELDERISDLAERAVRIAERRLSRREASPEFDSAAERAATALVDEATRRTGVTLNGD